MKLIIAGGRDLVFSDAHIARLDQLYNQELADADGRYYPPIDEVVSGGATGADAEGERWARDKGLSIKRFPPDWARHGKRAGPVRNQQMARYADAVALFRGGKGTRSMLKEAEVARIEIFDWRTL